jgi:hypothetical protein
MSQFGMKAHFLAENKTIERQNYDRLTPAYAHWRLKCISAVLRPHSLFRFATVKLPQTAGCA